MKFLTLAHYLPDETADKLSQILEKINSIANIVVGGEKPPHITLKLTNQIQASGPSGYHYGGTSQDTYVISETYVSKIYVSEGSGNVTWANGNETATLAQNSTVECKTNTDITITSASLWAGRNDSGYQFGPYYALLVVDVYF